MKSSSLLSLLLALPLSPVLLAQTTTRVSIDSAGLEANGSSHATPSISADGSRIAFSSWATNLASSDANGFLPDVFVHDRATGTTSLVSVSTAGVQGNDGSFDPVLSADGRVVAFRSAATNLVSGDTNGAVDVFVHDLSTGTTTLVSRGLGGGVGNAASASPSLSGDGRFVAFTSGATNLVAGDTNGTQDVFLHDRTTGTTRIVSRSTAGALGNDSSHGPAVSSDGGAVSFYSNATNLVPGDTNGFHDVFVRDVAAGTTERVSAPSAGGEADERSWSANLSADGSLVAFHSLAQNLVAGDSNGLADVFVHDRGSGTTERVNVDSNGVQADSLCEDPFISGDGRFVAFRSLDPDLVAQDTNATWDVFVHDRLRGTTTRANVHTSGSESNDLTEAASLSEDGGEVAFMSWASNLVDGDGNGAWDIFVHEARGAVGQSFCATSANSAGSGARIFGTGSASVGANDLELSVSGSPPGRPGVFYYGPTQTQQPFGDGLRCVAGATTFLYPPRKAGPDGVAVRIVDNQHPAHAAALVAGSVWQFQWMYRDPAVGQARFNLSDGLEVTFTP